MSNYILVTGGLGYIGGHTVIALINSGYKVVVLDNLSNSSEVALDEIRAICGERPDFIKADIRDLDSMADALKTHNFLAVMHFAALKSLPESIQSPVEYYETNVSGTINILLAMKSAGVKNFIFSSTAAVYGVPAMIPIPEDALLSSDNPYGESKLMVERLLRDLSVSDESFTAICLRYFNAVGAHASGKFGEKTKGKPGNLMPRIAEVAKGSQEKVFCYGGDYKTPDGTGVRDYIHVMDLAEGHVAALRYCEKNARGFKAFNLGCGVGFSVLDLIKAYQKISGVIIQYEVVSRRAGDVGECVADVSLAKNILGWTARYGLESMCEDSWRFELSQSIGVDL
jgi:UDP-glucose 4-epimerase